MARLPNPIRREEHALRLWARSFLPYQQRWLAEIAAIAFCVKARQIGFSHTTAGLAVKEALTQHSTNTVLSASQELSDEVLAKAAGHARTLRRLGYEAANPIAISRSRIVFPNGGRVIALAANPRTARSWSGNVYFDEAAYHDDFDGIWDAAGAMAIRGSYKIRIVSTPNGAQGLFYKWATQPPKGWSTHWVTVDDAIRQGMHVDIDRLWMLAGGDERIFAQWASARDSAHSARWCARRESCSAGRRCTSIRRESARRWLRSLSRNGANTRSSPSPSPRPKRKTWRRGRCAGSAMIACGSRALTTAGSACMPTQSLFVAS
jgi:phage FluMu gp28-like protein